MSIGILLLGVSLLLPVPEQDALVRKVLVQADKDYANRSTPGEVEKAIEGYQKALVLDEMCTEAYWKIAQATLWIGLTSDDDKKKLRIYRDAIEYCKMAVAIDDDCIEAHFWLGVMYGLFGEVKGILQGLHVIEPVKREMNWVISRDEKWNSAGAHRVLGRLYFRVPGIKGGDNQKSIEHLKKAVAMAPDLLDNHVFLAETYMDEGRYEEARRHLNRVVKAKNHPVWGPESELSRKNARNLLKQLEGK
jgi:tetratricopeptide (TPR) repeat protein